MVKFKWETEFKETELGIDFPRDWDIVKVSQVGTIGGGTTPSTKVSDYWDGDTHWITPRDLSNYDFKYISEGARNITEKAVKENSLKVYPSGTILLTSRAPIGYVAIAKNPVTTNQGFKNIIPNANTSSEFLFYLLSNITDFLKDISGGSTFGELTASTLKEVIIPYPIKNEQSRIASVLSWFDDMIENKKRQNELLEKSAEAIFKSWFIDFAPFKKEKFENSELGEIPKGWEVKNIGNENISLSFKGLSYNSPDISYESQGNLFITLNNFMRGGGFKTEFNYYIGNKAEERHKVNEGDLIIALTDMTSDARVVGAPAIVILPQGYNFGIMSLDCMKIKPSYEALKFYLYLYLKQSQEDNSTFANGVNVLHLNTKLFMQNKQLLIPPKPILEKFHSLAEPLFQKIIKNQKQILTLRKIKDTLLPLLVFGKLRVEEI